MQIVTPEPYVSPEDGYDICESCNYLEPVFDTYGMDDGSRVVPLCESCFHELSPNAAFCDGETKKGA